MDIVNENFEKDKKYWFYPSGTWLNARPQSWDVRRKGAEEVAYRFRIPGSGKAREAFLARDPALT